MKKEEVWQIYVNKNPKFEIRGCSITFTEVGIRQFFERTWDLAHSEGIANGRALEAMQNSPKREKEDPKSPFNDIFGNMFGEGLFGKSKK